MNRTNTQLKKILAYIHLCLDLNLDDQCAIGGSWPCNQCSIGGSWPCNQCPMSLWHISSQQVYDSTDRVANTAVLGIFHNYKAEKHPNSGNWACIYLIKIGLLWHRVLRVKKQFAAVWCFKFLATLSIRLQIRLSNLMCIFQGCVHQVKRQNIISF